MGTCPVELAHSVQISNLFAPSSYGLAGTPHPQQSESNSPTTASRTEDRLRRQNNKSLISRPAGRVTEDQDDSRDEDGSPADKNPVFGISNLGGDIDLESLFPQGVLSDTQISPTSSKLLFLQSLPSPYTWDEGLF